MPSAIFFFQAEDGIRDLIVTGVQTCALPISALHMALSMPAGEQRARMRLMRGLLQDFNVYRWAGRMLMDAAAMRRRGRLLERAARPERPPRRSPGYEAARSR